MDAVHVVGAGGIGCALGYALRAAGVPVVFVEANPRKVVAGLREGVQVERHAPLAARFVSFEGWQPPVGATVLLCTKCFDNGPVLARLPRGVTLIPIQNGFDPLLAARGHEFEGIASFVSECDADRPHTRITRAGELHVGRRSAETKSPARPEVIDRLAGTQLFRLVEVPVIDPFKHAKLMYNAAISPLAAMAGIDNGTLLSISAARRLFFALLEENYRILYEAGIALGRIGPFRPATVAWILRRRWLAAALARAFEPSLRGTYCSMAGEIQKGGTEIDHYNGYLIRLAHQNGTPCTLNQAVYDLVVRLTAERARPTPMAWRRLAAA
ncbi:MAG: ketopantoate reductase C-terminal domain-containing protein [Isosphaeraceae bacterium]|jgi:2-dehydropantoate 2-reductase